ncbi:MAG: flagellar export protein FliJ [bacterium]|nr:flagellar export protein FliJ [bacterium]
MRTRQERLQRLLRLRERREKQARHQLALSLGEEAQRRRALAETEAQLGQARVQWTSELAGGIGPARWSVLQAYIDHRQRSVALGERMVAEWQPRLAAAREELSAAARERQGMERWRDRLVERQRREEDRRERLRLDEIGLLEVLRREAPEHGEG